mmetsp:Transcript_98413/g.175260  ORF Transcript_98413/g.175260 Transcript_98413/m.175260 type:complete len:163 (-) Transcript_98413:250-738(-)|eukprot:CAMPEP_0197623254 /NCGR_PEP_ID=MMETSP1338-20131121/3303_1 /TAXON_ID=43686 ORGANISM="Pelagodinium beii, Strain RCC1491" /NCGR_SAMPLE_ID=MMETSP1338 /ASSEMBLY_ACC=CAM_ASM_000754 /LENGTH=162 /DNA_ID=CAMNT_0043193165 /DNA_START=53 /DNA_END=541 /DNA_ORIENTATION=-
MAPGPAEELDESPEEGLLWVPKTVIEKVTKALDKKESVAKEDVLQLIDPDNLDDEAICVPCDMSDADDIEDVENLIDSLGASKAAEIFVKARKKFLDGLQSMSEDDRAKVTQEMTGAEYKEQLEEEMNLFAEAMGECGESEAEEDDDEEVAEEPPSKKQKTN